MNLARLKISCLFLSLCIINPQFSKWEVEINAVMIKGVGGFEMKWKNEMNAWCICHYYYYCICKFAEAKVFGFAFGFLAYIWCPVWMHYSLLISLSALSNSQFPKTLTFHHVFITQTSLSHFALSLHLVFCFINFFLINPHLPYNPSRLHHYSS